MYTLPQTNSITATFPSTVLGEMSPYPTVELVIIRNQMESR